MGWGCIFKEDSQQNRQAYVLSLLFLRYKYNETCGPNPSPSFSSVLLIYFVIFNFSFLTKVSCWRMYASSVWVFCAFIWQIVNIRFEWDSGVDDICFPLTSTIFNNFFPSKKPGVVQNIAFSYYTHCYLLTWCKECGLSFTFWLLTLF